MTTAVVTPLDSLAQAIARQQAELEALRREYEARQARLAELSRHKEELEAQLKQVEADMQAVAQGTAPSPAPTKAPSAPPAASAPKAKAAQAKAPVPAPKKPSKPAGAQTLPSLLVELVGKAGGPVRVKDLTEEVVRRKFPTTSRNVPDLVSTTVKTLVRRGVLRRAAHHAGVVLAKAPASAPAPKANGAGASRAGSKNGAVANRTLTPKAKVGSPKEQPTLREVVTDLLAKSQRPLAARELAAQALASGYQTRSKDLTNVIWVLLPKLEDVENIAGKGWRLKKR